LTSRSRHRGVSLAEALLTSFIMMMILAVVASLMRQYSDITRHAARKDASIELRQGLESIRHELMSAVEITAPLPGASSGVLEFTRVDPAIPRPAPLPAPVAWDPLTDIMQVRYERLVSGLLVRRVTGGGQQTVLASCSFFQATTNDRTIYLTGSVQEDKIVRSYQVQLAIGEGVQW
jgi:hypothetical protein